MVKDLYIHKTKKYSYSCWGFAHAADDFKVLRGAEGLLVANEGVALEEPEVAVVGLVLKEGVKEADGFFVALCFEEATGEADFPVFLVGLNEDGLHPE